MYAGLGLSAIVFITHSILIYDWTTQYQRMSLGWMGLVAVLNLVGAITYAARVGSLRYPKDLEKMDLISSPGSRKMAPRKIRHSWQQSPSAPRHGHPRRTGPYAWIDGSLRLFTYPERSLSLTETRQVRRLMQMSSHSSASKMQPSTYYLNHSLRSTIPHLQTGDLLHSRHFPSFPLLNYQEGGACMSRENKDQTWEAFSIS